MTTDSTKLPLTVVLDETILPLNIKNILIDKLSNILNIDDITFNDALVVPEKDGFRVHIVLNPIDVSLSPFGDELFTFSLDKNVMPAGEILLSDEKIEISITSAIKIGLPNSIIQTIEADNTASQVELICDSKISLWWAQTEGWEFNLEFIEGVTLPLSKFTNTDIILSAKGIYPNFVEGKTNPKVIAAGFDSDFIGLYAKSASLYCLPQITLRNFEVPGLRLDFEDVAIGNQGISATFSLRWLVKVDDSGILVEEETELLGYLFDENWQIAIESAAGIIRKNIPQEFSVKTFLRIPFFDAVFSSYFSLSYRVNDDDSDAYKTAIAIVKESVDPIIQSFLNDELLITVNSMNISGWLSDRGFNIDGQCSFAVNLFGFELDVESAHLAYTHQEKSDDLLFTLTNVELGELGTAELARLIIRSHKNDKDEVVFDKIEIAAEYRWADLSNLIPLDLQDVVGLPEDGKIEALIRWQEYDTEHSQSHKVVVKLLSGVSHLDNLWKFIPPAYRPEVRRIESMFVLTYDSVESFSPRDSSGNSVPPPSEYTERSGIEIKLSARMEVKLPDVSNIDLDSLDLIHIETGDDDGFITAEYKVSYSSESEQGESFQSGLTVENAFRIDLDIPGAEPGYPLIRTEMNRIGLQFYAGDDSNASGTENELGGRLFFEGDFTFQPLIPIAMPFADPFNDLMRNVGLDEIKGQSSLSLTFTEETFDLVMKGSFEQFGIELDIFQMLSSLSTSSERPPEQEIDIDFDIGFHLIGFEFKLGNGAGQTGTSSDETMYFSFSLTVECSMTGLPPLTASITLSNTEFSFGLESLTIPIEIPHYPISVDDLSRLEEDNHIWTPAQRQVFTDELDDQIAAIAAQLSDTELNDRDRFRLTKDKANFELKKLMLQLVMEIHQRVGRDGQPLYQKMIEADTWFHHTAFSLLHVDTEIKLHFPEIKFRIPFDDPTGIAVIGAGKLIGFADNDPLKPLEDYTFSLGLSSEYIFAKVESDGEPIPIPSFGSQYVDGAISIDKFMIGYGFTKNSFALDFAGQIIIPSKLIEDADTSDRIGAGLRVPRYNKLAFKIDLIPVTIVKATVLIPVPRFDLDLRTPNAPALTSTRECEPYWDGLEMIIRDVIHVDHKRLAFSPFFGFSITPNLKFDGDLKLGDDSNGLTLISDDVLVLFGTFVGSAFVQVPFFADPYQPYFQNICTNLRVAGFEINFNMQRPFPSASPLAALEAFGLISNPMMPIDPQGELANTIRFTLSDAYIKVPDFVLQMFPDAAKLVDKTYGFTLNIGTLINMVQSVVGTCEPLIESMSDYAMGRISDIQSAFNNLPDSFNPWDWLVLLPPDLRKFRTGGQIAGFEASVCLVLATEEEAKQGLKNKQQSNKPLPMLNTVEETDANKQFTTYKRHQNPLFKPTSDYQFDSSWLTDGDDGANWSKTDPGIAYTPDSAGLHYFIYHKTTIPEDIQLSVSVDFIRRHTDCATGIVFCYSNTDNYYVLKTVWNGSGNQSVCIERLKDGHSSTLLMKSRAHSDDNSLKWQLTTYVTDRGRCFELQQIVTTLGRGVDTNDIRLISKSLGKVYDTNDYHNAGKLGLFARNIQSAEFYNMSVYEVIVKKGNYGKLSQQSVQKGFNVNTRDSNLGDSRLICNDESASLFKGLEFSKFEDSHLHMIKIDGLDHLTADNDSIYIGAYIKVFEGQRFRFLGQLFEDGSFALLSEMESKPLRITVLGIPIHIPFAGYGNFNLIGRQKRNGFYGYVEANGYFDWEPVPNVVKFVVGSKTKPVSLKLHSNGQFNLQGGADVFLFNGAGKIVEGSVYITDQKAAFEGQLKYEVGPDENEEDYNFTQIAAIDIQGAGNIEGIDKYRFHGRGEVKLLGETFTNTEVYITERYARFDIFFRKNVNTDATSFERQFPILSACNIELNGSCELNIRKTVRPAFRLTGEGHIEVLGATIYGKGEIRSLPSKNQSLKNDFFEAMMEGNLFWQGRKWLGGKIAVGSKGLNISGTTNFGIDLTPKNLPFTNIRIANLSLLIQLEGEFILNANKQLDYFLFKGSWTLGAAIANTGSEKNNQIFPLASSQFAFTSNVDIILDNEYCLNLFNIDGFKFVPFKGISLAVPSISLTKQHRAKTLLKMGKTRHKHVLNETYYHKAAVELYTPVGNMGLEYNYNDNDNYSLPGLYFNESRTWSSNKLSELYSAYDVSFDQKEIELDFSQFSSIKLSLVLQNDLDNQFPIKLKLDSVGPPKYISFE